MAPRAQPAPALLRAVTALENLKAQLVQLGPYWTSALESWTVRPWTLDQCLLLLLLLLLANLASGSGR